jgi:hypothetical protein
LAGQVEECYRGLLVLTIVVMKVMEALILEPRLIETLRKNFVIAVGKREFKE